MGLGRFSAAIAAFALTLSACSSGGDQFAENTIAVLGEAGDVVLVDVATGDVISVPDGDGAARGFPVWSPDGSKLAFTTTSGAASSLGVFDGETVTSIPTAFPSFYNYWDPSSEVIGYLGDYQGTVGFGVADTLGGTASVIDSSQPYFFSWADDGSRVVSHSELELRVVDRAGEVGVALNVSPAFQAPVWLAGGETVLVALPAANGSRLVALDVESGEEREYFRAGGVVSFVVDPTGRRLAVVHRTRPDDDGVILTAAQESAPAGLFVVDLESGGLTLVDDHPLRISPFWSPDGEKLLSLTVDDDDAREWARWEVHDLAGDLLARTERMQPSRTVAQLLPFADQYAQSSTPWAPDGGAFLFAGTVEDGAERSGIYVHTASNSDASERLTDGTYAVWSPR